MNDDAHLQVTGHTKIRALSQIPRIPLESLNSTKSMLVKQAMTHDQPSTGRTRHSLEGNRQTHVASTLQPQSREQTLNSPHGSQPQRQDCPPTPSFSETP